MYNVRNIYSTRFWGLILGPVLFIILVLSPPLRNPSTGELINPEAPWAPNAALGLMLWVIIWWITHSVPYGVASLVVGVIGCVMISLSPSGFGFNDAKTGVSSILQTFFHRIIWVFWGGFMLAYAMEKSGFAKRLVLKVLSIRVKNVFWLYVVIWTIAWFLSWWMSNTAATALIYPVLAGLVSIPLFSQKHREIALLGLAFGATLGGMATLIGTPPNLVAVGFLDKLGISSISFFEWMRFAVPLSTMFYIIMIIFFRIMFGSVKIDPGIQENIRKQYRGEVPDKLKPEEKLFLFTFIIVVSLWILRGLGALIESLKIMKIIIPDDSIPAVLAGLLLFGIPLSINNRYNTFFNWKDALSKLDWDTLFLFAGGLAMGTLVFKSGAGMWLGEILISYTGGQTAIAIMYSSVLLTWALTQVSSNTATTNALIPIALSIGITAGLPVSTLVYISVAIALTASIALTLPVSTPPNAIVFAGGLVRLNTMAKYGIILSIIYLPLLLLMLQFLY